MTARILADRARIRPDDDGGSNDMAEHFEYAASDDSDGAAAAAESYDVYLEGRDRRSPTQHHRHRNQQRQYRGTSKGSTNGGGGGNRRRQQQHLSDPTPDGHPLKPWVKSLRQQSSGKSAALAGAGAMTSSHQQRRIEGEPLGAMRKRWSYVPSRVRDDVRKDRDKWLQQQRATTALSEDEEEDARGGMRAHGRGRRDAVEFQEFGATGSAGVATRGRQGALLNADEDEDAGEDENEDEDEERHLVEEHRRALDETIVSQQCQPQTPEEMAHQLADDRLNRYFDEGDGSLDRDLLKASSYYKPRNASQPPAQQEPPGANGGRAEDGAVSPPDSQQ
eukprot:COSAG06_NODE_3070_length_5880_cov_2.562802_3_plen_335_part_00